MLGKKGRMEIIDVLSRYPKRDFSINELAREANVPVMSCWRAVKDFEQVGFVIVRSVGKTSAVRFNEKSEMAESIESMLKLKALDPYRMAAQEFSSKIMGCPWAKKCVLFGSVLKGAHKPGSDVDLAIIYDDKKAKKSDVELKVAQITAEVEEKYRIRTVTLVFSECESRKKLVMDIIEWGEVLE
ncbi:MAG: nucleotidyltransferase domain-containing protein [Candidatus Methanoperedens sp.]|nr:nucleotidyltransferase domain-containing protein [Candidatus Methanoperedens sp.]